VNAPENLGVLRFLIIDTKLFKAIFSWVILLFLGEISFLEALLVLVY